jgi:hypothetical protein
VPRRSSRQAQIFSLADARHARRLSSYRERLNRVLRANRRAIGKLCATGSLFTAVGVRAGRDLLAAHEQLLRVMGLLDRLDHVGDVPAPRSATEVEAIFTELDTLLARTAVLAAQTRYLFAELKPEP